MKDQELISTAIAASGLSLHRFAEDILGRDPRTVRRWRGYAADIPPIARVWLRRFLGLSDETRQQLVNALRADRALRAAE